VVSAGSVVLHAEIETVIARASKKRQVVFIFSSRKIIKKLYVTNSVPNLPYNG
jgi:hypothetical protein